MKKTIVFSLICFTLSFSSCKKDKGIGSAHLHGINFAYKKKYDICHTSRRWGGGGLEVKCHTFQPVFKKMLTIV